MRLVAPLLLLASGLCFAQSFEAVLPTNFAGCGVGYNGSRGDSWCSVAVQVSQPQALYSYSTYDFTFAKGHLPVTSTRTGLAMVLRHFTLGHGFDVALLGMTTMGVSQTSTSLQGSFSGGGQIFIRYKGRFSLNIGIRQAQQNGPFVEAGLGITL
jgi:hypothetical protein